MFAILAAIIFGIGVILTAAGINPARPFAPWTLLFTGLFCVALHLALGIGIPWRRA